MKVIAFKEPKDLINMAIDEFKGCLLTCKMKKKSKEEEKNC